MSFKTRPLFIFVRRTSQFRPRCEFFEGRPLLFVLLISLVFKYFFQIDLMVDSDSSKKFSISYVFLPSNFLSAINFLTSFVNSFDFRPMVNDTLVNECTRMQTTELYKLRQFLARNNSVKVPLNKLVFVRSYFSFYERGAYQ